jgi:hypothetical protein
MLAVARLDGSSRKCVARGMDKQLQDIQRQMKQQTRGRMWRPSKELRTTILAWVAGAQAGGHTWREISAAVGVDKLRIKAWQRAAAQRSGQSTALPMGVVPVRIAPTVPRPTLLTAVVIRGLTVEDVAALVATL